LEILVNYIGLNPIEKPSAFIAFKGAYSLPDCLKHKTVILWVT
jgi:hypothetical protein